MCNYSQVPWGLAAISGHERRSVWSISTLKVLTRCARRLMRVTKAVISWALVPTPNQSSRASFGSAFFSDASFSTFSQPCIKPHHKAYLQKDPWPLEIHIWVREILLINSHQSRFNVLKMTTGHKVSTESHNTTWSHFAAKLSLAGTCNSSNVTHRA